MWKKIDFCWMYGLVFSLVNTVVVMTHPALTMTPLFPPPPNPGSSCGHILEHSTYQDLRGQRVQEASTSTTENHP